MTAHASPKGAKSPPKDKSHGLWIWDAAIAIRRAKVAPKCKDYIRPLVFTKRHCDVFDDEHLRRVVRAHQDFNDEPGFIRVMPIEKTRAKDGNLTIPLYVGGETQAQIDVTTETTNVGLPGWLERAAKLRKSSESLIQK